MPRPRCGNDPWPNTGAPSHDAPTQTAPKTRETRSCKHKTCLPGFAFLAANCPPLPLGVFLTVLLCVFVIFGSVIPPLSGPLSSTGEEELAARGPPRLGGGGGWRCSSRCCNKSRRLPVVFVLSWRPLDGCTYHREAPRIYPKFAPRAHCGKSALQHNQPLLPSPQGPPFGLLPWQLSTGGYHSMIRNPPGLCYVAHGCGGEHPPNCTVMGRTEGEASPAWEGRQGAEAARGGRATAVPSQPSLSPWLGTDHAPNLLRKTQTSAHTRINQPAHLLSLCGKPDMPLVSGWETGAQQRSALYHRPLSNTRPPHHQNSVGTCCVQRVAQ